MAVTHIGAMNIAATAIAQPGTPAGRSTAHTANSDAVYANWPYIIAFGSFSSAASPSIHALTACTTAMSAYIPTASRAVGMRRGGTF